VFENNTFENNVGLHGGAIHIDQQLSQHDNQTHVNDLTTFIYFKNNSFSKNMAYFEGNAVFIRGA
jgi:hypothetical protein